MAYFFLDQLLYPSDQSASESQRGRGKRCGGGGPDWCDKKRGMRRAFWEAHFGMEHGHGPHGPHGPHGGPPHHGHGPWGHHHHHHGGRHWGVPAARGLPIDFIERGDGFEILADIPGVEKSDIKLSVEGDVLSIKVERSKTAEAPAPDTAGDAAADDGDFAMVGAEGGEHGQNCGADAGAPDDGEGASGSADVKYHQHERSTDFPARAVRFPDTADLSNVKASYINGVLKLEVPKLPAKEPQQISIA